MSTSRRSRSRRGLVGWVGDRAHHRGPHGQRRISRQRQVALWMTIFAAVRTCIWVSGMVLIGVAELVGYQHGGFLHAFMHLNSTIVWVVFISYYCNASTDGANLAAGLAALFSADSHQVAEESHQALTAGRGEIERDIARLAELHPGPDGQKLADQICARLKQPA